MPPVLPGTPPRVPFLPTPGCETAAAPLLPLKTPPPDSKSSTRNVPAEYVPAPESPSRTVFALVEIVSVPARGPVVSGVNVTSIRQLAPGASAGPKQPEDVNAKSLESAILIVPIVNG